MERATSLIPPRSLDVTDLLRRAAPLAILIVSTVAVTSSAAVPVPRPTATIGPAGVGPISAFGDRLVYSRPVGRRFELVVLRAGRVSRLPVATRGVPFDVDVGPDRDGGSVAVYSRCAEEPSLSYLGYNVAFRSGSGCRLFRYDFSEGAERPIPGFAASKVSRITPTIWGARLAWTQTTDTRSSGGVRAPQLWTRLRGRRPVRLAAGSPFNTGVEAAPGAVQLDLRRDRLAMAWQYSSRTPGYGGSKPASEAWGYTIGNGRRLLAFAGSPGDGGRLLVGGAAATQTGWALTALTDPSSEATEGADSVLFSLALDGTPLAAVTPSSGRTLSFSPLDDGRYAFVSDGRQIGRGTLRLLGAAP